jgi:hypothetical protein
MNDIIRRRAVRADQLRDGVLLDFDDSEPGLVSDVKHLAKKVLFKAHGCEFALDKDELVNLVIIMRLVG